MKTAATKLTQTRRPGAPQVIGLLRVSGNDQEVARQEEDMEAIEREFGVQVFKRLEIEGLSGADVLEDEDINRILDELADAHVAGLAVSALDRLLRVKRFKTASILDRFVEVRKPIYSASEGFIEPWTDKGFEVCWDAAGRGGAELRRIRARSMTAKLKYAKLGIQCAASAPYGFRYQGKRRAGKWLVHEPEAAIVREMYRRAAELGWTGYRIAQWLNAEGIPTQTGGQWDQRVARRTLTNPAYIGKARFAAGKPHETSIAVPAILTGEQVAWWDAYQVARSKNRERWSGRPSPNYLFQSLIYCRCGKRLTGTRQGCHRRAYACSNRDWITSKRRCLLPQIQCERLDNAVWVALIERLSDPATIEGMLRSYEEDQRAARPLGPDPVDRLAKLRRDEIALNRKLDDGDLLHLWDETKKKLLALRSEIAMLERELARAQKPFVMPCRPSIRSFAAEVREAAEWTSYQDRRGLVERIVSKVIYAEGEFDVECRVSFAESSIKPGVPNPDNGIDSGPSFVPLSFRVKIAA